MWEIHPLGPDRSCPGVGVSAVETFQSRQGASFPIKNLTFQELIYPFSQICQPLLYRAPLLGSMGGNSIPPTQGRNCLPSGSHPDATQLEFELARRSRKMRPGAAGLFPSRVLRTARGAGDYPTVFPAHCLSGRVRIPAFQTRTCLQRAIIPVNGCTAGRKKIDLFLCIETGLFPSNMV